MSNYDSLTAAERQTILNDQAAADRPQPVDYGLTYYDLHLGVLLGGFGVIDTPVSGSLLYSFRCRPFFRFSPLKQRLPSNQAMEPIASRRTI
jgi:hypothetical protein